MRTSKLPITGLIVLGVLALFLVQNSSPTLSITFFGITSIALPLGIWLLIPFLAGVISAWFVALLLPRGDRNRTQASRTMESAGDSQPSPRRRREHDMDEIDLDEKGFEPEAESSPGKTVPSDEKRWASSEGQRRRPSPRHDSSASDLGESEAEVWDDADWPDDEKWSDEAEVNPSGVAVGNYEVHKEPVSAYRQGTVYSYSYSKSTLRDSSEPDSAEGETSERETIEAERDISEADIPEAQLLDSEEENSPLTPDLVEGSDPLNEDSDEEEAAITAPELMTAAEEEDEPEETLDGEFLEDSEAEESEQKSSGFFQSKLFNVQQKSPQKDDWIDPPTPPKDW